MVNWNLACDLHGLVFAPSAQYSVVPATHMVSPAWIRSRASRLAASWIEVTRARCWACSLSVPRCAAASLRAVRRWRWGFAKPTCRSQSDRVDLATSTSARISRYESPCLLSSIARLRSTGLAMIREVLLVYPATVPSTTPGCESRSSGRVGHLSPARRHKVDQRPTALQVVWTTPESINPDRVTQLEHATTVDTLDPRFKVGEERVCEDVLRQMIASARSAVSQAMHAVGPPAEKSACVPFVAIRRAEYFRNCS